MNKIRIKDQIKLLWKTINVQRYPESNMRKETFLNSYNIPFTASWRIGSILKMNQSLQRPLSNYD
jgi:hypothetical protein